MKEYVVGFGFCRPYAGENSNTVCADKVYTILLEKVNPAWQRGRLNGPGGKIEAGESALSAMVREYEEEVGLSVPPSNWTPFCELAHPNEWRVMFFRAWITRRQFEMAHGLEAEAVIKVTTDLSLLPDERIMPNLRWLIPMALDETVIDARVFDNTIEGKRA